MATAAQRAHLGVLMDLLVAHEPLVHYPPGDVRGSADAATWKLTEGELRAKLSRGEGIQFDCSQSYEQLLRWAGLKYGGAGPGYTGSLLANLPHYKEARYAMVGAGVVFGPGTGHHICMVRKPGRDPLLFSHGQERGPMYIRLSQERQFQPAPATFLSIARL